MRRPPAGSRFNLKLKCSSLQLYTDYQVQSYMIKGNIMIMIAHPFHRRYIKCNVTTYATLAI